MVLNSHPPHLARADRTINPRLALVGKEAARAHWRLSPRIHFGQIQLLLCVLELFADVFLISLALPLHLLADGRELFVGFVTRGDDGSTPQAPRPRALS